jgi:hypothetical protein
MSSLWVLSLFLLFLFQLWRLFRLWRLKISEKNQPEPIRCFKFANDGHAQWAALYDLFVSPDGKHTIELACQGQPPHGDFYSLVRIDGIDFPGYAWDCFFGFSPCSQFAVFSWMPRLIERRTVVVELGTRRYFILPEYIYEFFIDWPHIIEVDRLSSGKRYSFSGQELWQSF